ncbi:MAG: hypothetical protein KDC18_03955 [Alphaproteobacteria bacterium]|nr:hypothetical protein [Alphaproteobacteria bacterium]MCB9928127.1 hypothetical protein [Alphaproteobacteria bacterium]
MQEHEPDIVALLQDTFNSWLVGQWPEARRAYGSVRTGSDATAAPVLATFLHDISGTAALAGAPHLGKVAHVLDRRCRACAWRFCNDCIGERDRLWRVLAAEVERRIAGQAPPEDAMLATVADLLTEPDRHTR